MTKRLRQTLVSIGTMGSALAISFGVVFGLAVTQSTTRYLDYANSTRFQEYMHDASGNLQVTKQEVGDSDIFDTAWNCDRSSSTAKKPAFQLIIDGSTHQTLDQSFNQSAFWGTTSWVHETRLDQASLNYQDLKPYPEYSNQLTDDMATSWKPIADTPSGFIETYKSALGVSGAQTLILPGYLQATPLKQFADNYWSQYFSTKGFIFLDYDASSLGVTDQALGHIASILFRADQSAFLAAISTCQYLNNNFDAYWTPTKPLAIGTYGGQPMTTITAFMGGFELGTYLYNYMISNKPSCFGYSSDKTANNYFGKHLVNFIDLGRPASWFSYSYNIGDGRLLTQTLLAMGADAIMAVAGPQTIDTVQEIKNQGSKCIVVGVDTPQEDNPTVNDSSAYTDNALNVDTNNSYVNHVSNDNIIKFSAIKGIQPIINTIGWLVANGYRNTNGHGDTGNPEIGGYGYLTVGELANNGAGVSDAAAPYLMDFIHKLYPGASTTNATHMSDIVAYILNQKLDETELPFVQDPVNTNISEKWMDLINNNMWFRT